MKTILTVYQWIFKNLPKRFTLPFLVVMLALLFGLWPRLVLTAEDSGWDLPAKLSNWLLLKSPEFLKSWPKVQALYDRTNRIVLAPFLHAAIAVLLFVLLLVFAYKIAAWFYQWTRGKKQRPMVCAGEPARPAPAAPLSNESFHPKEYEKIGIILSGGGAKGVYQAGAMKAIDEFLRQYNCLEKVKMIAGTSIGSWNSLFWLADRVYAEPGKRSLHEEWWSTVDMRRVISFDPGYWPMLRNSVLLSDPWKENFEHHFGGCAQLKELLIPQEETSQAARMHFYMTRSNVGRAQLEFTTNWTGDARTRGRKFYRQDRYEEAQTVANIKRAVFSSMDLPPLFPYMKFDCKTYEDGGVVDNLPIVFGTQVEECDLLFVLLLNASFEKEPDANSIFLRLYRVMDVRQGVLEKNALRLAYLYNEKYALGKALEDALENAPKEFDQEGIYKNWFSSPDEITQKQKSQVTPIEAERAKKRKSRLTPEKPLTVVAICPNQPLQVGTTEFWKTKNMGCAFKIMYESTRSILQRHHFPKKEVFLDPLNDQGWIRVNLVSPQGTVTQLDDF